MAARPPTMCGSSTTATSPKFLDGAGGSTLWRSIVLLKGAVTSAEIAVETNFNGNPVYELIEATYESGSSDTITGTDESDFLPGAGSDDSINGEWGDDIVLGMGGADTLDGGAGADTLLGGDG